MGMKLMKDETILMTAVLKYKTNTAVEIRRFLTQNIIRQKKTEN
jgi:hypothetical protein